ncbi:hypothetical protein AB1285_24990 [Microbacterium sp. NRRL B-14842]|uniref:hypothetical protein n=1 Tax=Microbacterium sp. NRRL B-14842 TaxID=3162881 RepID=UPI003D2CA39F
MEQSIAEPLRVHRIGTAASRHARVLELLEQVALPAAMAERLPHELSADSGSVSRSPAPLALEPELVVLGRGGLRARRAGAGAGSSTSSPTCRSASAQLPLHQPRPRRRAHDLRRGARHAARHRGRERHPGELLRHAAASVHRELLAAIPGASLAS